MDTREVPEDQQRKQILTYEAVRGYLRQRKHLNGKTYSQQLDEWLPENYDDVLHEHPDDDVVNIKATPEVHEKVHAMTGKRVKPGDVVAFYTLLAAVRNGDTEVAYELIPSVPTMLFDLLNDDAIPSE